MCVFANIFDESQPAIANDPKEFVACCEKASILS